MTTVDTRLRELAKARDILESGQEKAVDRAWAICNKHLSANPNDPHALLIAGFIYEKAQNPAVAYQFYRRVKELEPKQTSSYINFGRIAEELWQTPDAEKAYLKGMELAKQDSAKVMLYQNMAALCIDNARYEEGEKWARKSLAVQENSGARSNLGFCQLAQRNWVEGWKNYRNTLGTDWRKRVVYKDEPEWDGTPGKTVVLYGEQGLGDEISFASMLPDAIAACKKVIIDCDPRLQNLLQRSFPKAKVYGTRNATAAEGTRWAKEDFEFDCSLAIGQIGEYYRTSPESFDGKPYLIADPDRVMMWKSLFATKRKPVIGIAWSGGIPKTGARARRFELAQLQPLFDAVDAHWVNLQYRQEDTKGFPVTTYPYATLTKDYDDTAALVAACDLVICMQTAVAHLGGALGVPTWVFVPKESQWRYGGEGDSIPWYSSLRVIRQTDWTKDIKKTAEELRAHFSGLSGTAAKAA